MMIETRNITMDKDEEQLHKLQEKIELKKQLLKEKGSEYTISTCLKVELNYVDENNLSLYHILFPILTEKDNKEHYIRLELVDMYCRMPVFVDVKKELISLYDIQNLYIYISYDNFIHVKLDDNTLLRDYIITPVVSIRPDINKNIIDFPEDFIRLILPTNLSAKQDISKVYQQIEIIQSEHKFIGSRKEGPRKETWKVKTRNKILPDLVHKIINTVDLYMISNITEFSCYTICSGSLAKNILFTQLVINKNN
jgi:hypothetical protein